MICTWNCTLFLLLSVSFYVYIFLSLSLSMYLSIPLSCYLSLSLSSTHSLSLAISLFLLLLNPFSPWKFFFVFLPKESLYIIISYSCCSPQLFISSDLFSSSCDLFLQISGFNTHGNFGTMFTILNFCHLLFPSQFSAAIRTKVLVFWLQFVRYGKNVWSITQVDYKVSRKMIHYHTTVFSQLCDRLKYMRSKYSHSSSLASFKIFWIRSCDYY